MLTQEELSNDSRWSLKDLIEFLPDAVLLICPEDTHLLGANSAAVTTYGYDSTELLSLSIRDLRAPGTHESLNAQLSKAVSAGHRFRSAHRRKDGSCFPVEVCSRGAEFHGRRVLLSVIRDVSLLPNDSLPDVTAGSNTLRVTDSAEHHQQRLLVKKLEVGAMFEATLADQLALLLAAPYEALDSAIVEAQRQLCGHLGMDRSAIWQGSVEAPQILELTHLCTLDEIPSVPGGITTNGAFPWITEQLLAGNSVAIPDLSVLPAEAQVDRKSLLYYGDRSTLAIPLLQRSGLVHGAISFAATTRHEVWSEVVLRQCRLVAQGIGNVLARKRADEQLEMVKISIEKAQLAAFWFDAEGHIVYVNDEACQQTGYAREELLGKHGQLINPRATPERWAAVFQLMKMGGADSREGELVRKDGTLVPVAITSNYFRSCGKDYCIGFAYDLRERRRNEQERKSLESQLYQAQRLESVGRLAGGIAHDFNNMLTAIQLNAKDALEQTDADTPIYEALDEVILAATRSAELTRQLLTFARQQPIAPKALSLNDAIDGILRMLRRLVGENLEFIWYPGRDLWLTMMDPSQVDQILANLCVNARDAIDDVGRIVVTTSNRTLSESECCKHSGAVPGDYVRVSVKDDGCGIDSDQQTLIFEPFYTTKGDGKGTGLGLSTVYGIVSQNRGFMDVQSVRGKGSTFHVYLPRYEGDISSMEVDTSKGTALRGTETVLIVDDEPSIRDAVARVLSRLGYTLLLAKGATEALQLVRAHAGPIDLLLTDVVMPEMNGRELALKVAKMRPTTRCLYTSGHTTDTLGQHAGLDAGDSFIQKPFFPGDLAAKVRQVLDEA